MVWLQSNSQRRQWLNTMSSRSRPHYSHSWNSARMSGILYHNMDIVTFTVASLPPLQWTGR